MSTRQSTDKRPNHGTSFSLPVCLLLLAEVCSAKIKSRLLFALQRMQQSATHMRWPCGSRHNGDAEMNITAKECVSGRKKVCVLVCVHKKKLVQTKESSLEATKLLCIRHKPLSFLPFKGIQLPLTLCTPCRRWDNNDDGNLSLNELRGEETVNAILSIGKEVQKDRLVPRIGNEQMLLFSRSTSSKIKYRTSQ